MATPGISSFTRPLPSRMKASTTPGRRLTSSRFAARACAPVAGPFWYTAVSSPGSSRSPANSGAPVTIARLSTPPMRWPSRRNVVAGLQLQCIAARHGLARGFGGELEVGQSPAAGRMQHVAVRGARTRRPPHPSAPRPRPPAWCARRHRRGAGLPSAWAPSASRRRTARRNAPRRSRPARRGRRPRPRRAPRRRSSAGWSSRPGRSPGSRRRSGCRARRSRARHWARTRRAAQRQQPARARGTAAAPSTSTAPEMPLSCRKRRRPMRRTATAVCGAGRSGAASSRRKLSSKRQPVFVAHVASSRLASAPAAAWIARRMRR